MRCLKKYALILIVLFIIAMPMACFVMFRFQMSCQTKDLQRIARLDLLASSVCFSSDSKSFFVNSGKTLYHYDIKGNILWQIDIEGTICNFAISTDGETLGVLIKNHIFSHGKYIATPIDFITINVKGITISKKVRLFSGLANNTLNTILFSPTTKSWIVFFNDNPCENNEEIFYFLLWIQALLQRKMKKLLLPRMRCLNEETKIFTLFPNPMKLSLSMFLENLYYGIICPTS